MGQNWQEELAKFDGEQHKADYIWNKKRRSIIGLEDYDLKTIIEKDKCLRRNKIYKKDRLKLSRNKLLFVKLEIGKHLCIYCGKDVLNQKHVSQQSLDRWKTKYGGFPKRCYVCFKEFNKGVTHPCYKKEIVRIDNCLFCGKKNNNVRKARTKFCSRLCAVRYWARKRITYLLRHPEIKKSC